MQLRLTGDGGAEETTTAETQTSDDTKLHNYVGSAVVTTSVDEDTGRAETTLDGMAGTSTRTAEQSDDLVVGTDTGNDSIADVEQTEQRAEDVTDGRAFGDPTTEEDIGSGAAVTTVPDGEQSAPDNQSSSTNGQRRLLAGAAVVAGLALAMGGE